MTYKQGPKAGGSRTAGQHHFALAPQVDNPRSTFDRSCGLKTAFDPGELIPIFVDQDILPGDTVNMKLTTFGRFATMLRPIMDNIILDIHFWAVPTRLVWDNWEKMHGAQTDPGDSISFTIPQQVSAASVGHLEETLADFMGIPPGVPDLTHSTLPFRCYNLIWNEHYRAQELQDSLSVPTGDAADAPTLYTIKKRGKRYDYFTGCLVSPQRGTAISISLGTTAPVIPVTGPAVSPTFDAGTKTDLDFQVGQTTAGFANQYHTQDTVDTGSSTDVAFWNTTGLIADMTAVTALTVNALRLSVQTQKILERDARSGTRYPEAIKAHFGVTSPDFRHQRPEFCGGGKQNINIMPVAQTGRNDAAVSAWVGELGSFGTTGGQTTFVKSFTEHTILIGLASFRADLVYQQGLERQWSRLTRYDHYLPAFAHLGEQAVLNKEIYAQGIAADDLTFGYQERWAEYRYKASSTAGVFRSTHSTPIDLYHLAQNFSSLPVLDGDFIEEDPPIARIIAVDAEKALLLDCWFDYKHTRPMPVFSVPGNMDRF